MSDKMDVILEELRTMQGQLQEFRTEVDSRFQQVDARFDRVDERFEQVDARFDGVDARMDGFDARFDRVDERIDGLDARFDRVDTRMDSHERMIEQLIVLNSTTMQQVQSLREDADADRKVNSARHEMVLSELRALRGDFLMTYEKASHAEFEVQSLKNRLIG